MTAAFLAGGWWSEVWASYVDLPEPVTLSRAPAGSQAPPELVHTGSEVGFEVGFVAVEFDAGGQVMGDGHLYSDRGHAQDIVNRRNASEGEPELLDRWFVLAVVVDTAEASAAHLQACALRPGQRWVHNEPADAGTDLPQPVTP